MPQHAGITLNNSHLLRAAMTLVVVGMIGPGLFQLQPPKWSGAGAPEQHVEMLAPPVVLGGDIVSLETELSPAPPSVMPTEKVILTPPDGTTTPAAGSSAVTLPAIPASAIARKQDVGKQKLRGPNTEVAATQLAALQQGIVPERPAVKARRTPPSPLPKVSEAAPAVARARPAKAPAAPPVVSSAPPVPVIVARDFTRSIPAAHKDLPVQEQKAKFIAMVLPLILAANEEIAQRRTAVLRAAKGGDADALARWAKLYRVSTNDKSAEQITADILMRADFIPVSLALAQAAIESGWGTSRFARQGNALFGQWAWQASAGIKPAQASNSRAVVRSFPNLFGSVRAYMHNLNTHPSYASFRERRKIMRGRSRADLGYQLAKHLDSYAEIGLVYVDKLQTLIRTNEFGRFETAKLR